MHKRFQLNPEAPYVGLVAAIAGAFLLGYSLGSMSVIPMLLGACCVALGTFILVGMFLDQKTGAHRKR